MTLRLFSALLALLALAGCGSDPEPRPEQPTTPSTPRTVEAPPHVDEDPIDEGRLLLATSGPGGQPHRLAHELQTAASAAGEPVSLATTGPSHVAPLYLVAWGHAQAAIVPANVYCASVHGVARQGVVALGAIGAPEEVHVVVPSGSEARTVGDLQGKVIMVGNVGSPDELAASALLIASGLDPVMDVTLSNEPCEEVGKGCDAAVIVGDCVLVHGLAGTRLLPLAADDAEALAAQGSGYALIDSAPGIVGVLDVLVAHPAAADALRRVRADLPPAPSAADGPPVAFRLDDAPLRIAAGPGGGGYASMAEGLSHTLELADIGGAGRTMDTQGSVENLALLASGLVDLAFVQEDVLADALRTPAVAPLLARVRLVTPLHREAVHLCMSDGDAPFGPDARLEPGEVVALGELGSGTYFTARRLLRLAGAKVSGRAMSLDDALPRLGRGVDAAFAVGGQLPSLPGSARLVAIAPFEGYAEAQVSSPAGQVTTIATRALLLCRRDLPDGFADALVRALYANRKNLSATDPRWGELDPAALGEERQGLRLHGAVQAAASALEPDSAAPW